MLKESYPQMKGDFKAEARFYLDSNDYNIHWALEDFKKDEDFE